MTMERIAEMSISTQRLIIRRFSEKDAAGLFALRSDPDTCSDNGGYAPVLAMDEGFNGLVRQFVQDPGRFSIIVRSTGEVAGNLHVMEPPPPGRGVPALELGYSISKDFRRQGIATEAVKAVMDYCCQEAGTELFLAGVFSFNLASQKMLEKLGFIREGITYKAVDHPVHGLVDMVNYYWEKPEADQAG